MLEDYIKHKKPRRNDKKYIAVYLEKEQTKVLEEEAKLRNCVRGVLVRAIILDWIKHYATKKETE